MLMLDSTDRNHLAAASFEGQSVGAEQWRDGIGFRIFLEKLHQRRPMIVGLFLIGLLFGMLSGIAYSLIRVPTFSASAELLVSNTNLQLSGQDAVVTQLLVENSLIQSAIEMLKSSKVLDRVIDTVGLDNIDRISPKANRVRQLLQWITSTDDSALGKRQKALMALRSNTTVNRVGASQIISVRGKALTPEDAANLTNALANAFVQVQNDTSAVISTNAALRERIKVLGPTARVVSEAFPPPSNDVPTGMVILLPMLLGGALGAFIGIAVTIFDRRVRSAAQLTSLVPSEFFGYVPPTNHATAERAFRGSLLESTPVNTVLRRARSALIERSARTPHFVGVTSCRSGDGKSMIAAQWGLLIAHGGSRVLVVDASRSGVARSNRSSPSSCGLQELLRGDVTFADVVKIDISPNLDLVPGGEGAGKFDLAWGALVDAIGIGPDCPYQWIILELPPITSADVRSAGQILDDLLLVVEWGRTSEAQLTEALRALGPLRHKVLGTVIVNAPKESLLSQVRLWLQAARRALLSMNGTVVRPQADRGSVTTAKLSNSTPRDDHDR